MRIASASIAQRVRAAMAAAAGALVLGCVATGLPTTYIPPDNTYVCRDSKTLNVMRAPDGRSATVAVGGRSVVLPLVDSAVQQKYSNGPTTLYLDGQNAVLTSDSFVVAGPCVSSVPLPVVPQYRY